ncbi:unnamed protein product [Oreochromis niloticus]|nr:unnamed protein product [Mustela putorius furo]
MCFSFGIGEGASSALINGMAKEGGGHAQFIIGTDRMQPKSSEAAEGCVTLKYSLAGHPSENQLHFSLRPAEDTGNFCIATWKSTINLMRLKHSHRCGQATG